MTTRRTIRDVIEPGNSAAGAPTHANRSVKSFFKQATGGRTAGRRARAGRAMGKAARRGAGQRRASARRQAGPRRTAGPRRGPHQGPRGSRRRPT